MGKRDYHLALILISLFFLVGANIFATRMNSETISSLIDSAVLQGEINRAVVAALREEAPNDR